MRWSYDVGKRVVAVEGSYVTSDAQIPELIDWINQQTIVGLDLETSGLKAGVDKIATLQVGNPLLAHPRAAVVDVRCISRPVMMQLLEALMRPGLRKLGQNIRFEYRFLKAEYGVELRELVDTQVLEQLIHAGLFTGHKGALGVYTQTSMAALCRRYLGVEIDKDHALRMSFYTTAPGRHDERQLHYAAGDVIYVFYLLEAQKPEIQVRGLSGVAKIECGVIPVLANMEMRGIRLDVAKWNALWQEAKKELQRVEEELDELIHPSAYQIDLLDGAVPVRPRPIYPKANAPINYDSSAHVAWAIKAYCQRIEWPREIVTSQARLLQLKKQVGESWLAEQTAKGRDVGVADVPEGLIPEDRYCLLLNSDTITLRLRKCRGQLPPEIVDRLVEYSLYSTRVTNFGIKWMQKNLGEDGRVRAEVHQLLAATGRLSTQPNLQNIPADQRYRACFIPSPGYAFVIADYSQIEPRISAYASQDPAYCDTFINDRDLYSATCERMMGHLPVDAVERQIFKVVVLALAYRMGSWKLRDRLTLALEEEIMAGRREAPTYGDAQGLHYGFFDVHTGIKEFQAKATADADPKTSKQRIFDRMLGTEVTWVEAVCGRKRFFPPDVGYVGTEAPNVSPQGGSATIIKAASIRLQEVIDTQGYDACPVNLVHDEVVYEVLLEQAEEFALVVKEVMESVGQHFLPGIPVKVEFPKGSNGVVPFWAKKLPDDT